MPRYTTAYSSFIIQLNEVEILHKKARQKERLDPIGNAPEINALCRGAIVLLSSHIEAYIKEIGELAAESLVDNSICRSTIGSRFFYHLSKAMIDELKNTSDPEAIAKKVFQLIDRDGDLWQQIGPFPRSIPVDQFNKGFSNPAFDKIKAYFGRFGYETYKRDLQRELKADYQPIVNMVDHLVDIRNKIAHGDPSATKTPSEVHEITTMIRRYCITTDSLFASWWRDKYCAIR